MKTLPAGITEGQTLEGDLEVGCDLAVIGSGAGGAVTAATAAQAGLSVVLLEEGGAFGTERFRQREDEAYPFLYQDGGQRATKDGAIAILQGRALGGGTTVNWTTCFRTPDYIVEHWRKKHAVGGVSVAELAPHWQWAEERLAIAEVPLPLVNANNQKLLDGAKKLGFETALLRRNVIGCAGTGNCGHGCPIGAKQGMLNTLIPDAIKAGAAVLTRARADRVLFESARAVAVECTLLDAWGVGPTGLRATIKPKAVVVSGGAINSPALLLRSNAPDASGRLGRRTFLHPVVAIGGFFDDEVAGWRGPPQSVASHAPVHRGEEMGYFLETAPVHPMLAATSFTGFGGAHAELFVNVKQAAALIALQVDGLHDDVVGGTVSVLSSGRAALDYPIVARQWRGFIEAQKTLIRVALAAGARTVATLHEGPNRFSSEADLPRVDALPWRTGSVVLFSAHQMGGCMMSDDPKQGVVRSSDLRHHQIDNLFVVDGSVFPTATGVNPQLSIYGLAHLAATRIVDGLSKG
ncbi:MAG: GMC family oxidoreductase [Deltaproteobacteria bacterium]|nr:GMC family oxidoreductase [Deltaproteobacteria bacterium]